MTRARGALALALFGCLLSPLVCQGQQERNDLSGGRLALWGGLSGAGLALAYVNPPGEGWLVSDESALPFGVALGLGAAVIVRAAGRDTDVSIGRRPRLRVSVGTGGELDLDYSLAYRQPLGSRSELDVAILVASDTWERLETQTRCGGILGCITGTFLTDYAYQQSVTALLRGILHLAATSAWSPTISVGGGPTVLHVESAGAASRHTGVLLDAGAGIEHGRRYRWTAATGVRATPIGSVDEASIDDLTWYVRVGLALGG